MLPAHGKERVNTGGPLCGIVRAGKKIVLPAMGLIAFSTKLSQPLDNKIENLIRPMALGRKNFLFCGSHRAAQHAAMFYSFFGSCKLHGVNPREWLENTLSSIKDYKVQNLEELLPGYQRQS